MSKGWINWSRAKEEKYFEKENQKAIEKLSKKIKVHLSPETGEPMEIVSLREGIEVERDPATGGIWVDDEAKLEKLIAMAKEDDQKMTWKDYLKTPIK